LEKEGLIKYLKQIVSIKKCVSLIIRRLRIAFIKS
jgi:hypothetical protein